MIQICRAILHSVRQPADISATSGTYYMPVWATMLLTYAIMLVPLFHSSFRLLLDGYEDVALTRVGYVSTTTAKLWIRYPFEPTVNHVDVDLYFRPITDSGKKEHEWKLGRKVQLIAAHDWIATAELSGLKPATTYEYSWSMVDPTGDLLTILGFPSTGRLSTANATIEPMKRFSFKTLDPESESLSLVFGSCIKPNYPYGEGLPGFGLIAQHRPDLMLFMGDFIYVDIGFNFGTSLLNYARLYREVLGQTESVQLLSSTPFLSMWDDHELINNYEMGVPHVYENASEAFYEYLATTNPQTFPSSDALTKTLYYTFKRDQVSFFVLDVRSFRNSTASPPTMLGRTQLTHLKDWIENKDDTSKWRVVVTPVPFTLNWRTDDLWYGYLEERESILDSVRKVVDEGVQVIFLSGDRHQLGVTQIVDTSSEDVEGLDEKVIATEFSVSPINMFWIPAPVYFETPNYDPSAGLNPFRWGRKSKYLIPGSKWKLDRKVFYAFGPSIVGWLHFGNLSETDPSRSDYGVVFCAFVKGRGVSQSQIKSCGGHVQSADLKGQRLLFRHVVSNGREVTRVVEDEEERRVVYGRGTVSWLMDWVSPYTKGWF